MEKNCIMCLVMQFILIMDTMNTWYCNVIHPLPVGFSGSCQHGQTIVTITYEYISSMNNQSTLLT